MRIQWGSDPTKNQLITVPVTDAKRLVDALGDDVTIHGPDVKRIKQQARDMYILPTLVYKGEIFIQKHIYSLLCKPYISPENI